MPNTGDSAGKYAKNIHGQIISILNNFYPKMNIFDTGHESFKMTIIES